MAAPEWDEFLESHPQGQFQQSAMWAAAKAGAGWQVFRTLARRQGELIGGAQVLVQPTRAGKVAFVNKGPVVDPTDSALFEQVLAAVGVACRRHRVRALIVQLPDHAGELLSRLQGRGFARNHFGGIVRSTLVLDLGKGAEPLFREFRKSTRWEVRRAERGGVRVREGAEADLPVFFELMLATCQRQQTRPNPATVEELCALWAAFRERHRVRLTLAEVEGKAIGGLLSLRFGERVTVWKKGGVSSHNAVHASSLLIFEAVRWGCEAGCRWLDFGALRPDIARALLDGQPLSEPQKQSRDFFELGFGGVPWLQPESLIHFPNPLLRWAYAAFARWKYGSG